jgi:hypothetical protein
VRARVLEILRSTTIRVQGDRLVELFSRRLDDAKGAFWVVAAINGRRTVISHYLTHDDLENRLSYATAGDVEWRNASPAEIPRRYSGVGLVMGCTIPDGKTLDFQSLALHLPLPYLPVDRFALASARRSILGRWSDGAVSATFGPKSKLTLSTRIPANHPFAPTRGCPPSDWWRLSAWQLYLMNQERKCGLRMLVLRVDADELHVALGTRTGDTIAHVFRRVDMETMPRRSRTKGWSGRGRHK